MGYTRRSEDSGTGKGGDPGPAPTRHCSGTTEGMPVHMFAGRKQDQPLRIRIMGSLNHALVNRKGPLPQGTAQWKVEGRA